MMNYFKYSTAFSNCLSKQFSCDSKYLAIYHCQNYKNPFRGFWFSSKKYSKVSEHASSDVSDNSIASDSILINSTTLNSAEKNDFVSEILSGIKAVSTARHSKYENQNLGKKKEKNISDGPDLKDFLVTVPQIQQNPIDSKAPVIPYLSQCDGKQQKVFLDVYGCQMNVNDSEVISSILKTSNYKLTKNRNEASIILLVTCSIRDNAEQKIWNRLKELRHLKKKRDGKIQVSKIGLLGCMAERLKHKIIEEENIVDVIAGPDSYKDLPRLLSESTDHETAINVALSFDETYADVMPVRLNPESKTAYVSIMRGCDNMCTYCIVPFTRGRERSRPISSILDEVKHLSDQGVKEITLLGQNVNSYRDTSESNFYMKSENKTQLAKGFKTVYKSKEGGLRFSDLLEKVSIVNPEVRIRFTSPHPKDFPDEVLHLIAERQNICRQLHIPAQSGSSSVLERMRRGYTRESYLDLVHHIKDVIPNVYLSSDFICGFCGETDEEFEETLTLIEQVKYNTAFLYAYSMREKTTAHRRFSDDIPKEVKQQRLVRMIKVYRTEVEKLNKNQIGQQQLVLIEGKSKRSNKDLQGRNDGNIKVIIRKEEIPESNSSSNNRIINIGDYVVVHICNANSQVLSGIPLYHSSNEEFNSAPRKDISRAYM